MSNIQIVRKGNSLFVYNAYEHKGDLLEHGFKWDALSKAWYAPFSPQAERLIRWILKEPISEDCIQYEEQWPPSDMKTKLWKHQIEGGKHVLPLTGGMLAHAMGSGKSATAIGLLHAWDAKRVLILCPLSVTEVWPKELGIHSGKDWRVEVLKDGNTDKRAKRLAQAIALSDVDKKPLCVIVNYDAVWRSNLAKQLGKKPWDVLVLDEIHRIKAPGGKASRWIAAFANKMCTRRLGLTGTPMPHSPMDIYAQIRAIEPLVFGSSFARFRSRYAVMGGYGNYEVIRFQRQDELAQKMGLVCHRITKEESLSDLPKEVFLERRCELEPSARKIYESLKKEMIAEVDSGLITASNALVKMLRLQQVTSGFLETEEGGVEYVSTAKKDLLIDTIEDLEFPIVVFCRFRRDLLAVQDIAVKLRLRYGEVSGSRKDLVDASMPADVDIMAVQIQSGGVGIDLKRSCSSVWYSPGFSLGDYEQACARLHRKGQERSVKHVHLVVNNTIDDVVFKSLRTKKVMVDEVLSYLKELPDGAHKGSSFIEQLVADTIVSCSDFFMSS